jgi:hypothetical protein
MWLANSKQKKENIDLLLAWHDLGPVARRAFGPARRPVGRALGHTPGTRHGGGTARPARRHGAARGRHGTARPDGHL